MFCTNFKPSIKNSLFSFLSYAVLLVGFILSLRYGSTFMTNDLHYLVWPQLAIMICFLFADFYPYKTQRPKDIVKRIGFFLEFIHFIGLSARCASQANTYFDNSGKFNYSLLVINWIIFAVSLVFLVCVLVGFVLTDSGKKEPDMSKFLKSASLAVMILTLLSNALEFAAISTGKLDEMLLSEYISCVIAMDLEALFFYFFTDSLIEVKDNTENKASNN